jgi:hypothetical protein
MTQMIMINTDIKCISILDSHNLGNNEIVILINRCIIDIIQSIQKQSL